ncbi:MAG: type II toxin-antitoxin system VapC family toxin [Candidatus Nanohalobium sp.]
MKLLDTSAVVEIDRGNTEKVAKLDREGKHAISQATITEMFMGLEYRHERGTKKYRGAREDLEKLLSRFKVLEINRPVSIEAARIMAELKQKGKPVNDLHDTYIAATALKNELELLTRNIQDFEEVENLQATEWNEY